MLLYSKSSSFLRKICFCLLIALATTGWGCAKAPTQKPKTQTQQSKNQSKSNTGKTLTYSSSVQPILSQKCVNCHQANGPASSILLDSYDHVMKYVTPGDPGKSRLIQAVIGGSMSDKLSSSDAQVMKDWVTQGAKK